MIYSIFPSCGARRFDQAAAPIKGLATLRPRLGAQRDSGRSKDDSFLIGQAVRRSRNGQGQRGGGGGTSP